MNEPSSNNVRRESRGDSPGFHRRRSMRLALGAGVLTLFVFVAGAAATGWWWPRSPAPQTPVVRTTDAPPSRLARPAPPVGGYVGSEACQACHAKIAESYRGHPMARSMGETGQTGAAELINMPVEFSPTSSRRYRVEVRDAKKPATVEVLHHELGLGADGEVLYDQAEPVRYAIGSGRRGRAFVIDRDGYLFMSPISWYAKEGTWDLSPEYKPQGHPRFERAASERCLTCHAGRQAYVYSKTTEVALRYGDPPFAEMSIGCERCHGPGAEHIQIRKGGPAKVVHDPIVNPARLDPPRRESVCNQCHLQGAFQILRYGRNHDDFRPGNHLGDVWSVFVSGTGVNDRNATLAVSHVEQMTASRCYVQSQGALGCLSCHDAHSFPKESERAEYYSTKCLKCHADRGCALPEAKRLELPFAGVCTACHMPPLKTRDVPHTAQTDHRILRDSAVGGKPNSSLDDEGLRLFDEPYCSLSELELSRAQGLVVAIQAEMQSNVALARQAEELLLPARIAAPDDVEVLDSLAAMYALQGKTAAAVSLWEAALEIEPQRQDALSSLAVYYHSGGDLLKAAEYLDRLLAVNPWQIDGIRRRADVYARLGQTTKAIHWAERAINLDPSHPQSYLFLAEMHDRAKQSAAAELVRMRAKKLGNLQIP